MSVTLAVLEYFKNLRKLAKEIVQPSSLTWEALASLRLNIDNLPKIIIRYLAQRSFHLAVRGKGAHALGSFGPNACACAGRWGNGMTSRIGAGRIWAGLLMGALLLAACSSSETLPPASSLPPAPSPDYVIGPLDNLTIFVRRNPELTQSIPVRPDGRVSVPLIEDLQAAGKTPTQLARDIEQQLTKFIQDPIVTVMVTAFVGPYERQIRVVGEASHPQAIPYRDNMTLLDVMIAVGGLTQFADGNRATLVRNVNGRETQYRVRIDDLIKDGDVKANVQLLPGDVLIVPQSWY